MRRPRVVILGAGISGLAAAWFLKKKFNDTIDLTILEQSASPGGYIQTIKKEGFLFETGPHSLRVGKNNLLLTQLLQELSLESEILPASSFAKQRYLWRHHTLKELPTTISAALLSSFTRPFVWQFLKEIRLPSEKQEDDESISAFFSRRFSQEFAECLVDPLFTGIYAGDIGQLSFQACLPALHRWEKINGSLLMGLIKNRTTFGNRLISFRNGMQTLPNTLAKQLSSHLHLSTQAKLLFSPANSSTAVACANGKTFHADTLIVTTPFPVFATLIQTDAFDLAEEMRTIPYASVAVVNLGFRQPVLKLSGFGYLIPSQENEEILGCIWDSSVFPQQNLFSEETRLTVLIGGVHRAALLANGSSSLVAIAKNALMRHLNIDQPPDAIHVSIAKQAIPQYIVGHKQKMEKIQQALAEKFPSIRYLGNAACGVSVIDCIESAASLIERMEL